MPTAKQSTGVVRYTGTADIREISAAQFKQAGVEGGKLVRWERTKGHKIPRAELDFLAEDDFQRIILDDGNFTVED